MKSTKSILSKDFILMVIGQIISLTGNMILRYALPLYLLNITGSSSIFGTVTAIASIPMIILFPIGGVIADRINKRNIMVVLDFGTAILITIFVLLSGTVSIVPLIIITLIILYGIQGAYQPAVNAAVPALVNVEQLTRANSIVNLISSVTGVIAPIFGGLLYSLFGVMPILYISSICFFLSAIMELFIHIPFIKRKSEGNSIFVGFMDLKESFHFMIYEKPILLKISLVYASINLLAEGLVLIVMPVLITQHFGFASSNSSRLYGYAQAIVAVGCVIGGILPAVFSKKLKSKALSVLIISCGFSILIGAIGVQFTTLGMMNYIALVISCGLIMVFITIIQIEVVSYVQSKTPGTMIGKVMAGIICICKISEPIGEFLYGQVYEQIAINIAIPMFIAAILVIGIGVLVRHLFYEIDDEKKQ